MRQNHRLRFVQRLYDTCYRFLCVVIYHKLRGMLQNCRKHLEPRGPNATRFVLVMRPEFGVIHNGCIPIARFGQLFGTHATQVLSVALQTGGDEALILCLAFFRRVRSAERKSLQLARHLQNVLLSLFDALKNTHCAVDMEAAVNVVTLRKTCSNNSA